MTPRGLIKLTAIANNIEAWRDWNNLAAENPELAVRFQPAEDAGWRKIDAARRKLQDAIRDKRFVAGVDAGRADGRILSHPVGTGGHTFEEYLRIKDAYEDAVFAIKPTDYQRGYGAGFDSWVQSHPHPHLPNASEVKDA